jgi:hypothetical protein
MQPRPRYMLAARQQQTGELATSKPPFGPLALGDNTAKALAE